MDFDSIDVNAVVRAQRTLDYWFYVPDTRASDLVDALTRQGFVVGRVTPELEPAYPTETLVVAIGPSGWLDRWDELTALADDHDGVIDGWETAELDARDLGGER